jgi:hypothetical protein
MRYPLPLPFLFDLTLSSFLSFLVLPFFPSMGAPDPLTRALLLIACRSPIGPLYEPCRHLLTLQRDPPHLESGFTVSLVRRWNALDSGHTLLEVCGFGAVAQRVIFPALARQWDWCWL